VGFVGVLGIGTLIDNSIEKKVRRGRESVWLYSGVRDRRLTVIRCPDVCKQLF
jgi:hypothetical protein